MWRMLARFAIGAFGVFLAAAVPPRTLAQQPQEVPANAPAKFEPGRLGAELWNLEEQSVKALGLSEPHALLVTLPALGGPAERAGLRPGDVIVELDGTAVGDVQDFVAAIKRRGAGRTV